MKRKTKAVALSTAVKLLVLCLESMTQASWPTIPFSNFPPFASHHQNSHPHPLQQQHPFPPPSFWSRLSMSPSNAIPLTQYVRPLEVPMGFPLASIASMGQFTPVLELPPDEEYLIPARPARRRHKVHNQAFQGIQRHRQPSFNEEVPRPAIDGMDSGRESSKSDQFAVSGTTNEILEVEKKKLTEQDLKATQDENFQLFQKLSNAVRETDKGNKLVSEHLETMPPDPAKKPVGIRKKTVTSPNGQVTYITEMLYDVEDNPHASRATRPPVPPPAPYIPPSTDVLLPPTDNPLRTTYPYPYPISAPTDTTGNKKTTESVTEWPSLPTPPTSYQSHPSTGLRDRSGNFKENNSERLASIVQAAGSDRRESNVFNDQQSRSTSFSTHPLSINSAVNKQTTKPMFGVRASTARIYEGISSTKDKTWKEAKEGLGAAAIAGIVIGSLVSITLLAGK